MTNETETREERQQSTRDADELKERASATTDPADNPGPRGNPPTEQDSVERGEDKLERVKPY
jgi:hypothetical protein